jgi:hypothetical protein
LRRRWRSVDVGRADVAELTDITRTALQTNGCRGWSVGVYNPDLDPAGLEAQRIVAYFHDVTKVGGVGGPT